ncbi:PROX2 protein, partial [Upupa epops]|nr:PROX2 protein [Upupa epops]
ERLSDQSLQAKRAKVNSSAQGINLPTTAQALGTSLEKAFGHQRERSGEVPRKRKLRVPHQGVGAAWEVAPMVGRPHAKGCQQLKDQLCFLEQQLRRLQEKFSQVCDSGDTVPNQEGVEEVHPLPGKPGDRADQDGATVTSNLCKAPLWKSVLKVPGLEEGKDRDDMCALPVAARVLSQALKHELTGVMSHVVDSVLKTIWPKAASQLLQQHRSLLVPEPDAKRECCAAGKCRKPPAKPSPTTNIPDPLGSPQAEGLAKAPGKYPGPHAGSFSPKVVRNPPQVPSTGYFLNLGAPLQDREPLGYGQQGFWDGGSRENPSASDGNSLELLDLHWGTLKLRSSVMRQQQQQQHSLPLSLESLALLPASSDGRHGGGGVMHSDMLRCQAAACRLSLTLRQMQETLTPGHLKKAKLMFFFARYPSSTLLKTYFLDVQFSRCITSQLIKWFSNFREFYYIQVEKFARQALLEGVVDADTLQVSRDSELFHALNTHYNKGNDFEVPGHFLEVASLTLREFFSAVRAGKDSDPSWKKPIYKIIAKLDSDIPAGFKATSCSQEL